jgi:hypothetical protein
MHKEKDRSCRLRERIHAWKGKQYVKFKPGLGLLYHNLIQMLMMAEGKKGSKGDVSQERGAGIDQASLLTHSTQHRPLMLSVVYFTL